MRAACTALLVICCGSLLAWGQSSDYRNGFVDGQAEAERAMTEKQQSYLRGYASGIQAVLGGGGRTVYFPVAVPPGVGGGSQWIEIAELSVNPPMPQYPDRGGGSTSRDQPDWFVMIGTSFPEETGTPPLKDTLTYWQKSLSGDVSWYDQYTLRDKTVTWIPYGTQTGISRDLSSSEWHVGIGINENTASRLLELRKFVTTIDDSDLESGLKEVGMYGFAPTLNPLPNR